MCGIAGLVGNISDTNCIHRMLRIMNHRGPDAQGFFISTSVQFGHCRLAINDLSEEANQPFRSDDGQVTLIVNGEIYNFSDLRIKLENQGCVFKSNSDSEVVLHGYIRFGIDFIKMLNGMFALALFDKKKNQVYLVRDRLGIKPLYYSLAKQLFVFGSEIKALAQCEEVDLSIDQQSLAEYLTFENYFSNRTLNENIKLVQPGEIVEVAVDTLKVGKNFYWTPSFSTGEIAQGDLYEEYLTIIERSVNRHLLSDVPVGAYLSSGIDSSSVVYWASKKLKSLLKTYTGSFGMAGFYDESGSAKKIAEYFHCQNENVQITPSDFVDNIEKILWHLDEPRVGMGSFSQYMVAKRAAEDVKVILTGHGGDELFAGYPVFKAILGKSSPFGLLGHSSRRELMYAAYFLLGPFFKKDIRYFLPTINSPASIGSLCNGGSSVGISCRGFDPYHELEELKNNIPDDYQRLVLTYLRHYLPALFVIEDKISMAHSLESRTPLCDNELLDFALKIPLGKKLEGFELKHIPRTAMKDKIPSFIYNLPKRGFPTPLRQWFKADLKNYMRDFILDNISAVPFMSKNEVEKIISSHCGQRFNTPFSEISAHKVWMLINVVGYLKNQLHRYSK